MIDYSKELVSALSKVLPTHYELALTADTKVPCISYQERNNYSTAIGDTIGISRITYTIKVWANRAEDIQKYSVLIDQVLRPLGFKRESTNELHDIHSTMIQKIMTFTGIAREEY